MPFYKFEFCFQTYERVAIHFLSWCNGFLAGTKLAREGKSRLHWHLQSLLFESICRSNVGMVKDLNPSVETFGFGGGSPSSNTNILFFSLIYMIFRGLYHRFRTGGRVAVQTGIPTHP